MHGFFRFRNVDFGQQVDGALPCQRLADFLVGQDLFGNLPADAVDRCEGRHRVLENHGDFPASELAQFPLRQSYQLLAAILDGPLNHCIGIGDQAHDSQQSHGLAGTRLTNNAQDFPLFHIKRHAINGTHDALFGAERNPEIAHLQNHWVRTRGSRMM